MRISRYLFRDILSFTAVLLAAVLALAWLALGRALDEQAWARADEAAARLQVELDQETQAASRLGLALRDWWLAGAYGLEDPARLEALALPVLGRQTFVSSVNFCGADGTSVLLLRTGGAWHTRSLLPGPGGRRQRWTRRRADGAGEAVEPWAPTDYDPRGRDWYRLAAGAEAPRWSPEAYRFMTTRDPGLTLSVPVRRGGQLLGVVALDVLLDDLTARAWAVQPTPGSRVVIADQQGRALILPRQPPFEDPVARSAAFLQPVGPILRPSLTELLQDLPGVPAGGRRLRLAGPGFDAYGLVAPYRGPAGLTWYVAVAIPGAEIKGESSRKGLGILALALVGLAALFWRAWAIARRFGRPLDALASASAPAAVAGPGGRPPPRAPDALQEALQLADRAAEEQLALREQVRASQRRETVGTLAGGVAHDVNNQLTIALGQIEPCLEALGPDHPQATDLALAKEALLRSGEVTKALLAYSRTPARAAPEAVDLNQLCRSGAVLLGRALGARVELVLELAPGLPPAAGVPVQLEQVLVNLVINARDAMPEGGRLTIATALDPEGRPCLSVRDTGGGMSPEVQARVFEAYFTTKPEGQGTGLGLAMVQGIARSHGGEVSLRSAPGAGSTFTVHLPPFAGAPAAAPAAAAPRSPAALAGRRILFADDEPALLEVLRGLLGRAGARVTTAADGALALAAWGREGPFDAVVSDLQMPGASGLDLYRAVRAASPGTPFLLLSGRPLDEAVHVFGPDPRAASLAKPFHPAALLEVLGRLLGAPGEPPRAPPARPG